jgi:hypothetical protein
VDLPVIGEAGDLPDAAVRIAFGADGSPEIDGDRLAWAQVDGRLLEIVDAAQHGSSYLLRLRRRVGLAPPLKRSPGAFSGIDILFVLDRRTRWADVRRMTERIACAGMWRISFAVRTEPGGEPGSFAVFLSRDRGGSGPVGPVASDVGVRIRRDAGDPDPTVVARAAAGQRARGAEIVLVGVEPDPDAPIEVVLACAEAARRGGADDFSFEFGRPTAAVKDARPWRFDVGRTPVDAGTPIAASRGRVRGALGGWPAPLDQLYPDLIFLLDPPMNDAAGK